VAKIMQERFKDQLDLHIHTTDSPEAATYSLKGSTNLFVNQEWVPLDVATSKEKMEAYLNALIIPKN
jgi:hypothetical protein